MAPKITRVRTYNHPVIEIMSMRRSLPERPPVYGQHGEEEDDEEDASRGEDQDVYLPSSGRRVLGRKVALGEPWQRRLVCCGSRSQGGRIGGLVGRLGRRQRMRVRTRGRIVAHLHSKSQELEPWDRRWI